MPAPLPLEPEAPPDGSPADAAPDDAGVQVGDLVILPIERIRRQVGCGERVGLVVEDRRNVVKVFFPDIDRAFWIDRSAAMAVAESRLPAHPLAVRLHRICRALQAVALEIYDREADADVFHVYTRGAPLEALTAVRDLLGADFRRLEVEPGGVRRAKVTVVFRTDRSV